MNESATWDDKLLGEQLKALSEVELDFDLEVIGFAMGEIDLRIEGLEVTSEGAPAESEINRVPSAQGDSLKEVSRSQLSKRLKKALEELTPEHRAVILLREVEGMS